MSFILIPWIKDKIEDIDFWIHHNRINRFYHSVKKFIKNLKLFLKFAWGWRAWDSIYTIEILIALLKENAKACKNGRHAQAEKVYRRAMTAAGYLERAYVKEYGDKTLKYLYTKNPLEFRNNRIEHDMKTEQHIFKAMRKLAMQREMVIQENDKKEAWEYLSKYIGYFWD